MRAANNPYNKYIGLTEDEAFSKIKSDGLISRIAGRDGVAFALTCDFRINRVNLVITNGVVIAVWQG